MGRSPRNLKNQIINISATANGLRMISLKMDNLIINNLRMTSLIINNQKNAAIKTIRKYLLIIIIKLSGKNRDNNK